MLMRQFGFAIIVSLKGELMEALIKELESRGLDRALIEKLGLKKSEVVIDKRHIPAIAMPYIKQGKIVNNKHRGLNGEKVFQQDSGGEQCFWNYDVITDPRLKDKPLYITEGEYDGMTLIQAGIERVVSVPNGAPKKPLTEEVFYEGDKYSYVEAAKKDLSKISEVILCFDDDVQGSNLLHDITQLIGIAKCKQMTYPKGCKDLNEALLKYGQKAVYKCVDRADWIELDDVLSFNEIEEVPDKKAYDIGIPGFEGHIKMRMGDFWVVTGIPSHGKTTFMNDVVCRVAEKHSLNPCIASFEQDIKPDFRRVLRAWKNKKPESQQSVIELKKADEWIQSRFTFIKPNYKSRMVFDLQWMLSRMAAAAIRKGCKVFIIDPWNELDHVKPGGMSLTEYVGHAIKELKRFCKRYDVCVIVVAHPVKPMLTKDNKLVKPNLYNISDSSHWYNKADLGLIVHRDKDKGTSVTVAKSRYHDKIGKPGEIFVQFNSETFRFMVDTQRS